jgi:DHA1 family bicyclomycin/chloramphenicol resistance-like MFS transporter
MASISEHRAVEGASGHERTPPHILTLVALAGVSVLAMNVFLPSLPAMAEWFETSYGMVQLSVALYLGANALLQLVVGPLSDRYGRRPVILAGLAIFMLATVGTLLAPTIEIFLAFRMLQAAVVTSMVLSRAIVRDLYSQDEAASMIGYVTMGMSVIPMVAPAFGGALGGWFGWQASFWLLLAAGGAMLAWAWIDLGETATTRSSSFREQVREYPELLRSRRFWGYAAAAAFASGAFFAYVGGAPFVGSTIFGLAPATLGLYFGAPAIGYFVGNGLSGRYSRRFGIDRMVVWGVLVTLAGLAAMTALFLAGFGSPLVFFGLITTVGLGNGLVIPNATAGMLSVRPQLAGTASGLGGALMIGGGALLSGLAGKLLTPESGAMPLILIMLASAAAAGISIAAVLRRKRKLGT